MLFPAPMLPSRASTRRIAMPPSSPAGWPHGESPKAFPRIVRASAAKATQWTLKRGVTNLKCDSERIALITLPRLGKADYGKIRQEKHPKLCVAPSPPKKEFCPLLGLPQDGPFFVTLPLLA